MRHPSLARLLPWLLLAVCPPLLDHCGGAVEHGTETGNPPVVEQQKLHIVLGDRGVQVVGDAGAVSAGASVRVTNRSTSASVEATAGADGSIHVVVPGSLQDEYEVTVSNGAGSQTVQVSAATNAGAADAGALPGAPVTCNALESALVERVSAGFAAGDQSCRSDGDCTSSPLSFSCYYGCSSHAISASGAAAAQAAVEQDIAPLCGELARCARPQGNCPNDPSTLECYAGSCQTINLESLSCDDLSTGVVARLDALDQNAERSCTQDADCTLTGLGLRCIQSCGSRTVAVAASSLPTLTQNVQRLEDRFCGAFERPGAGLGNRPCPPLPPLPCAQRAPNDPQPLAHCNAGQCEVNYTGPT